MKIVKQISSLDKVRLSDSLDYGEISKVTLLKGERFSYQIAAKSEEIITGRVEVVSNIKEHIKVFFVQNAVMDYPVAHGNDDCDYITKEPGLMPDILIPAEEQNNIWQIGMQASSVFIEVCLPEKIDAGEYDVTLQIFDEENEENAILFEKTMTIKVVAEVISSQKLIYTRWLYLDCIADAHSVEVFSEKHWSLIDEYAKKAVDAGINMLMIPTHTPPLDTKIGGKRTCIQLVDIEKRDDEYIFSFEKFHRYVEILKKNGIKYFQTAHMFTQWGAKNCPNIKVTENGKSSYMFGWHVSSQSTEYKEFLKQYIPAICDALKNEEILENTYFSISDEPNTENMEMYKMASKIIRSVVGKGKTIDALSEYEFYEKGLVETPVTIVSNIHEFLEHNIENQWVYYCCIPQKTFPNGFLSMPHHRARIMGFLMYKYNIKGFLHWGFNFYNSQVSRYKINPYATTSAGGRFPSGDAFIVYPAENGAYSSLRGKTFFDAVTDMRICQTLERYIGKDAVIELIDEMAGFNVRFDDYPRDKRYIINLHNKMVELIDDFSKN